MLGALSRRISMRGSSSSIKMLRHLSLALASRVSSVERETAFRSSTIGQSRCFFPLVSPGSSASIKPKSYAFTCWPFFINHGFQMSLSSKGGDLVHAVVPHMGESISHGTVAKFLKNPGDRVQADEAIAQGVIYVLSPVAGVIQKFISQKGETVEPGMEIAVICMGAEGAALAATADKAAADPSPAWKRTEDINLSPLITILPFMLPRYEAFKKIIVGFKLTGKVQNSVTATDLIWTLKRILQLEDVSAVEFYGEGVGQLSLADRVAISRATRGAFLVDYVTLYYFKSIGLSVEEVSSLPHPFE